MTTYVSSDIITVFATGLNVTPVIVNNPNTMMDEAQPSDAIAIPNSALGTTAQLLRVSVEPMAGGAPWVYLKLGASDMTAATNTDILVTSYKPTLVATGTNTHFRISWSPPGTPSGVVNVVPMEA